MTPPVSSQTQSHWVWLGRMHYEEAAALQERLREEILSGRRGNTLLLLEHPPVITLGRSANPRHVLLPEEELQARGISVAPTSRGGDVTFHGPGQLVGYPIFRLRHGVVRHVEAMAEAVCSLLRTEGIEAQWRRECPGVWVENQKICAFGIHVRHGVAIHGFALNISVDLRSFDTIVPCGLPHTAVASLQSLRGESPRLAELATRFAALASAAFGLTLFPCTVDDLLADHDS